MSKVRARAIRAGYRSGIEHDLAKQFKDKRIDAKYEPFRIPYIIPEAVHKYTPWILFWGMELYLSKGRFLSTDRKKHLLIQEQYPHLDLRFVFSNSRSRLRKGSKTSYADWCEKNGFLFSDKLVPIEWLRERINRRSLTCIRKITGEK